MKNQQIFDIFNSSVFDSSVSEFEDEDGRYEIRLYNGGFLSTIGISADVSDAADQRLIDELNRDQAPFRYSMKDGKLQCTAFIWIDRRPSKKVLSEMIAVMTCNLKNIKQILEFVKEVDL